MGKHTQVGHEAVSPHKRVINVAIDEAEVGVWIERGEVSITSQHAPAVEKHAAGNACIRYRTLRPAERTHVNELVVMLQRLAALRGRLRLSGQFDRHPKRAQERHDGTSENSRRLHIGPP